MIVARNDGSRTAKGWYSDLARADLPAIGFATTGVDEPHWHREVHEVYLVAKGSSTIVVNDVSLTLRAGDVIVVEPGEVHTFTDSSPDYFHFVMHCPPGRSDKVTVPQA